MLADAFDPDWQVFVDGKKSEVLRCNYVMRGVYLEPGHHNVEFRFRPHIPCSMRTSSPSSPRAACWDMRW